MIIKKGRIYLILSMLIIFFSTGCKNTAKNKIEKPRKKVTLKIHAWEGYAYEHAEEFKKYAAMKLGMDVDLKVTMTTGLNSFIEAIEKNGVHIISPANDLLVPLKRKNLILQIDVSKVPNYTQINPTVLKRNAHKIADLVYAIPSNFGPYGIAYNKEKMLAPKSYKIFWDPKYKKRVSISGDYDTLNIYMTALMLGISEKEIFNLNDNQLKQIEEKLTVLCKDQVSEFWGPNLNPSNYKNFDIGMDWGIGVMQINDKYGQNWGFTVPGEGITGWIDTWAISRNVKDPDMKKVAYEYLNFMISPKVQAKMAQTTTYAPVNPYAGRYLNAKEKERYFLTDPNYIDKYILWQPLKPEVLKKYQELWKRVRKNADI